MKRSLVSLGLEPPTTPARFSWIVQGAPCGPDRVFDEDLAGYPEAAVIPTRGALVAEWLLVIPRTPCLSIAQLHSDQRMRLLAISDTVSARISAQAAQCVTFEHGANLQGSATACGVDQAHIHVVAGVPASIEALAERVDEVKWETVKHCDPWATVPTNREYLMLRDGTRALRALVEYPVSQRLRRAVASALGRPDEWDYRIYPQTENAIRTKQIFRREFADAA